MIAPTPTRSSRPGARASTHLARSVQIIAGGVVQVEGVAEDVTRGGALQVRDAGGAVHTIVAGEVSLRGRLTCLIQRCLIQRHWQLDRERRRPHTANDQYALRVLQFVRAAP